MEQLQNVHVPYAAKRHDFRHIKFIFIGPCDAAGDFLRVVTREEGPQNPPGQGAEICVPQLLQRNLRKFAAHIEPSVRRNAPKHRLRRGYGLTIATGTEESLHFGSPFLKT